MNLNTNRANSLPGSSGGRMQWGSYGFLAGIVIGIVIGWMFGGLVGAFMRVALVLIVAVPVIMAYVAWRKFVSPLLRPPVQQQQNYDYFEPVGAIETRGVIRGTVQQPHPR